MSVAIFLLLVKTVFHLKKKYKANTIKHTNTEAKNATHRKMRKKNMVIVLNFKERNDAINKNKSNQTFQ